MTSVCIRRAEARDVPRLLALVRELARFEREPDAVTVTEEEMREAGFGRERIWFGWVAETSDAIEGMAICYPRYSTWRGKVLFLEDLYVREEARSRGIGALLFDACLSHARAEGYRGMRWQVLAWNEGAIRFYERRGARFDRGWWNVEMA